MNNIFTMNIRLFLLVLNLFFISRLIAQDGFIRAYQALGQLNDPKRFGPWLLRIVANQALNFRRSHRKDPRISLDQTAGDDENGASPLTSLMGNEPTAQEHVSAQELAQVLEKAIAELPENLRDHPTAVSMFLREARAAAALNHRNIDATLLGKARVP